MTKTYSVGMIGLDTSHALTFTKMLNDQQHPNHVAGARVVAGFPGGSPDMQASRSRVDSLTAALRDTLCVKILDTPVAVAERVDLVFIESVDGRVHLDQFKQIVSLGKPTFIDKPLTCSSREAEEIVRLADEAGVKIISSSLLRYSDALAHALSLQDGQRGPIVSCEVVGPLEIEPTQPGYFWYGVHLAEVLTAVMGSDYSKVEVAEEGDVDVLTVTWDDGRSARIRADRACKQGYSVTLKRQSGDDECVDLAPKARPWAAGLLEGILDVLTDGHAGRLWRATAAGSVKSMRPECRIDPTPQDMLKIIRLLEAGNQSKDTGQTVSL